MVWGGRRLAEDLDKPVASDEPHGESWELSDHPLHQSVVATGPSAGRTLRQLVEGEGERLFGPAAETHQVFPWLVKFLDCTDWLSVQVHPDEEAVRRLAVEDGSKTEAWFVLHAAPGSRIFAGLAPGVDEAGLRAALAAGSVGDCLHSFEPRPGDCIFLPAGTVHAVGGGVLMAEVQQTSDATFRLFDWGRPRPLHVEESLRCVRWDRGPVEPVRAVGFTDDGPGPSRPQPLVRCRYFHLDYHRTASPAPVGGTGRLQVLIVLEGRGRLETGGAGEEVGPGQVWLLPAAMAEGSIRPRSALKTLLCTLP
jgi:mannose-6-phosphate isomerase